MFRNGTGLTETGPVRDNNEDSILVRNEETGSLKNLYIVADGMGGHNAGEIASSKAIEFFINYIEKDKNGSKYSETLLADGVRYANREVYRLSLENAATSGMGTTFTVCSIDGDKLYFAHVGDSRLYSLYNGKIKLLTEDHSYVFDMVRSGELTPEEAREHPLRNVVTRALGTDENVIVDKGYVSVSEGEQFLICSDGLTNFVSEGDIFNIATMDADNREKVKRLVELAILNRGNDNVSVILF